MAAAAFVVTSAAQELGAGSVINPLAPESENAMFNRLVQMLNRWAKKDIILGDTFVLPSALASEMNNDPDTDEAIIHNLAVVAAPLLRKSPTKFLLDQAKDSYDDLLISHVARPEQPYPSTMPVGSGRRTRPFSKRYYNEPLRKDEQTVVPDQQ